MIYDDPDFFNAVTERARRTDVPFQNPFSSNLPDPWRCGHCKQLIYNVALAPVATQWVPVPGAPLRAAYHAEYGDICQTCADMIEGISKSTYMFKLHQEYVCEQNALKEKSKRLGRNLSDGNAGAA